MCHLTMNILHVTFFTKLAQYWCSFVIPTYGKRYEFDLWLQRCIDVVIATRKICCETNLLSNVKATSAQRYEFDAAVLML